MKKIFLILPFDLKVHQKQQVIDRYATVQEGLGLGYVDLVFGSSLGWWAATTATYCPSRMMEHAIPISTQPMTENSQSLLDIFN